MGLRRRPVRINTTFSTSSISCLKGTGKKRTSGLLMSHAPESINTCPATIRKSEDKWNQHLGPAAIRGILIRKLFKHGALLALGSKNIIYREYGGDE